MNPFEVIAIRNQALTYDLELIAVTFRGVPSLALMNAASKSILVQGNEEAMRIYLNGCAYGQTRWQAKMN